MKQGNNVDNKQSPSKLVTKNFTKVPNWYFDELPKCGEPNLVLVVGFLIRHFVGWQNRTELRTTQSDLSFQTGIHPKPASRWLNVLAALDWIEYEPAANGGGKSIVRLLRLPEEAVEIRMLAAAIRLAAALDQEWMRKETHLKRDKTDSCHSEWLKRPRLRNSTFIALLLDCYRHIQKCPGCEEVCLRVPEVAAIQQSIKRLPPK